MASGSENMAKQNPFWNEKKQRPLDLYFQKPVNCLDNKSDKCLDLFSSLRVVTLKLAVLNYLHCM